MELKENLLLDINSFYNLSRYLFLNIEWNYNKHVEKNNITLPQLRVLWISTLFPGISLVEVAEIGGWAPPTVTKILRNLIKKDLIINKESGNKKNYNLHVTEEGKKYIEINKIHRGEKFPLFKLKDKLNEENLDYINYIFQEIIINMNKELVIDYIKKMNLNNLKIYMDDFNKKDVVLLHKLVRFYNCLRVFVLEIESIHRDRLKKIKLTYPQLRSLWIIKAFPGLTSIELSKIAYISPSTANVIVKNLYKKELIKKEKSKYKNSLYIHITEQGKKLIKEDFNSSQKNLKIYLPIKQIPKEQLIKSNEILNDMNFILENYIVKEYLDKTLNVINLMFL